MIEVFVAFAAGAAIPTGLLVWSTRAHERNLHSWMRSNEALVDRVQSADLASYYGARAAYHPEEFPAEPQAEYDYDDFGFVQSERKPEDGRLPGEMSADNL